MTDRPWVIVQHVAHEGPGLVADALGRAGARWTLVRADLGEPIPDPAGVAALGGVVVLGGPMGVHDDADHPWLRAERQLLARSVEADLAVLGICLGAQQLALALGAEVTAGDGEELGTGEVELTGAGRADPVLGPAGSPLECVHWHGDTFGVPDGAVLLASSWRYAHQGFRAARRAYGLQFHVEVDAALGAAWASRLDAGVMEPGALARVEAVGAPVLERFVALAGEDPQPASWRKT